MADDHEDSAEWRGTIESRVSTLEETATIQARARAGMDKDMSDLKTEFRAQRQLLQALAETQSEHGKVLRNHGDMLMGHGRTLREHGGRLILIQEAVQDVRARQATLLVGVEAIIDLLNRQVEATGPDVSGDSSTSE